MDYFGFLNVKRGRAVVKRCGVIFTCLNSRPMHLQLARSLESDCFINVLGRFINRRGPPKYIYQIMEQTLLMPKEMLERQLKAGTRPDT